ncbi:ATP-grasp domain-containing protein [Mycoplasmoides alvi]|uniref:ATP-grasp domain-containing protein n=1 Tax=Mycoplasmoides alvi TaxID=78580 RepID=UPI000B10F581|nr:ATP-grasp domain-containing protein [Mycoplasmoides alvi]
MECKRNKHNLKIALVYTKNDYDNNNFFADQIIYELTKWNVLCDLILIDNNNKIDLTKYEVIINRSRSIDFLINKKKDSIVLNNPTFTDMANNKFKTYLWCKLNKINVLDTKLFNKKNNLTYPFVIKEIKGHGGKEVYKINDINDLNKINLINKEFIIQDFFKQGNVDIRVYVMFKKILFVAKRMATNLNEFRSNFSINKNASKFRLNFLQKKYVKKIINKLPLGFYGLDFFINDKKKLILNEIEDVVGSRMIYHLKPKINVPKIFVASILKNLKKCKSWNDKRFWNDIIKF